MNEFQLVIDAVTAIRRIRAEYNIAPKVVLTVQLTGGSARTATVFREEAGLIERLANARVTVIER